MGLGFKLRTLPVVYRAKFEKGKWKSEYLEKPHKSPKEEKAMKASQRDALVALRNIHDDLKLVNHSTMYGVSCFEGLKAMPQKSGDMSLFRPDQNAARFHRSMKGLYMPPFPEDLFVKACVEVVKRNVKMGFGVEYKSAWEKDSFISAESIYLRPFVIADSDLNFDIAREPTMYIICSPVSSLFKPNDAGALVSHRFRATRNGTGWIKAAANYTISALAKHEASMAGYMEAVFLDAEHRKYLEEGSACNLFFYLKTGELVTPELGDTILPGITRASLIELARDLKIKVSERLISIEEVQDKAVEFFACGTGAGITPIAAITYKKKKTVFNKGQVGEVTAKLRDTLKGIQYGVIPDTKGWTKKVPLK